MSLQFGRHIKGLIIGIIVTTALSCAQKAKPDEGPVRDDVTESVSEQPARQMHGGVARKGFEAIRESKSLTESEKEKLLAIHSRMTKETFAIQDETSKLLAVLFETMTTRPYNDKKVNEVKKRLVALNDLKMKNMFQAMDEVQKIVGQKPEDEFKDFYRPFFSSPIAVSP